MIEINVFEYDSAIMEVQEDGSREISIGRSPGCVIVLDDPSVSRLHAVITCDQDSWVIESRSSYGTISVNGEEVENAVLQGGEEIAFNQFILRINLIDEPEGSQLHAREPSMPSIDPQAMPSFSAPEAADDKTRVEMDPVVGYLHFEPGDASVKQYIIEKGDIVIGRASNCDIVLLDKQSSRKHTEIRREGINFFLKDLGSANGTLVNNMEVDEVQLAPGDRITAGEVTFSFTVENRKFFEEQDMLAPVAPEAMANLPDVYGDQVPASTSQTNSATGQSQAGSQQTSTDASEKSIFKKWYKKYKALPQRQRYLVLLVFLIFIPLFFDTEEAPKVKRPKVVRAEDGTPIRVFAQLKDSDKLIVRNSYLRMLKAHEKREFTKMQDELAKIFRLVDRYKDATNYQKIARDGIAKQERQLEDERKRVIRAKMRKVVSGLEEQGRKLFEQAKTDPGARAPLQELIQLIYTKDPNNLMAQEWTQRLERIKAEEERKRKEEYALKLLKVKAEKALSSVEQVFADDKIVKALELIEKVSAIGYRDSDFLAKVGALRDEMKEKLNSIIMPLLNEAKNERAPGGDLVKSKNAYLKVLKVDPSNTEALDGLDAIKGVLHQRAKQLYASAMIAESMSALEEAKISLEKCLNVAPEDDIYYGRCKRKLVKYEAFSREQ